MTIAVTFPGEVTEQNGDLDGTTVTWTPVFGQATELHAVGSAIDAGSSMAWLLFIGLAVLLAIVLAIVIVSRGRGRPEGVEGSEVASEDALTPAPPAPAVVEEPPAAAPAVGEAPSGVSTEAPPIAGSPPAAGDPDAPGQA